MNGSGPGTVRRIHHVAFAHAAGQGPHGRLAELLGLRVAHTERAPGMVERMVPAGDCYLQLLEADGPGVVEKFVDRRGAALHHVAFEVDGLATLLTRLRDAGVRLVDEVPRQGGMGTEIAFVHPTAFDGLLVELVEAAGPVEP
ncbi:VOC family protein [Actinophytocola sp.]|uniref:VOC family protein n=1 Tax=Actinophytocola sp. TaxID=1872138 RepID=UPI003D6AB2F2